MTEYYAQNEQLRQLVQNAQRHPLGSPELQIALVKLIQEIENSGRICYLEREDFLPRLNNKINLQAKQDLLFYIYQNINQYDPERGEVMVWYNFLLERFFREAIPKVLYWQGIQKMSLAELKHLASPTLPPYLTESSKSFVELIESNSNNLFAETDIENYLEADFAVLGQQLEGKTMQKISISINKIPIDRLSSFYQYCLIKVVPIIREYLENLDRR